MNLALCESGFCYCKECKYHYFEGGEPEAASIHSGNLEGSPAFIFCFLPICLFNIIIQLLLFQTAAAAFEEPFHKLKETVAHSVLTVPSDDYLLSLSWSSRPASQDAAHDIDTLQRHKVSHVLNVAYGVTNLFPDQMVYKTLQILDLPDTDITSYFEECSSFIDEARKQDGVTLVHCNAGVSRSSSVVIGYLMLREGLSFDDAYSQVKLARPYIRPNPGFYQQLQNYKP